MDEKQLLQELRQYDFCTAIEVTNGIIVSKKVRPGNKSGKLEEKAKQARQGRGHILEINKHADVDAGIIAFRTQNIEREDAATYGINFIYRIRGYAPERAEKALLEVLKIDRIPQLGRHLLRNLLAHVRKGEDLESLLYPEQWKIFRKKFPELARNCPSPEQYTQDVQHIKGWVLEHYARLLCADAMPGVLVAGPWRYSRYHDIDLALAGQRETIYVGLNNPEHFQKISTAENYSSSFSGSSSFRTSSS